MAVSTVTLRATAWSSHCDFCRAVCSRLLLVLLLLLPVAACRKKVSPAPDARAITGQLVQAARKATGDDAEIRVFPALPPTASSGQLEAPPERLIIRLAGRLTDKSVLATLESDWQKLGQSQGLEFKRFAVDGRLVRYELRCDGRVTHTMQVLLPVAPANGVLSPGPRLALIIDDLGYELPSAERLFALPFRITAAVLPNHPLSGQLAERANQRGFQVLLHLPMESAGGDEKAEPSELRPGMTLQEI